MQAPKNNQEEEEERKEPSFDIDLTGEDIGENFKIESDILSKFN